MPKPTAAPVCEIVTTPLTSGPATRRHPRDGAHRLHRDREHNVPDRESQRALHRIVWRPAAAAAVKGAVATRRCDML